MTKYNIDYIYDCILVIDNVWVSATTKRLYFETESDSGDWVGCPLEEHDFYYDLIKELITPAK